MKVNTKQRKKARAGFEQAVGKEEMVNAMFHIIQVGKHALDTFVCELGVIVLEAIMDMEREEISGPEYRPTSSGVYKWAYQRGSVYIGDQKASVMHPRIRGPKGEISLESYAALKKPGAFSKGAAAEGIEGHLVAEI